MIDTVKKFVDFVLLVVTCGKLQLFGSSSTTKKTDDTGSQLRIRDNPISRFNISSTHLDSPRARRATMSDSNINFNADPWNIDSSKITSICEYVETPSHHLIFTHCLIPRVAPRNGNKAMKAIKGLIFYIHGYASHSSWIENRVGRRFCELGYIFMMHDVYGHGQSDGTWLKIDNFDTFVSDAEYVFDWAKRKYSQHLDHLPKPNYFLMGTSMGGGISILLSLKYKNGVKGSAGSSGSGGSRASRAESLKQGFNGMVLLAPMVRIEPKMGPSKLAAYFLANVLHYLPFTGNLLVTPGKRLTPFNSRIHDNNQFICDNPLYFNYRPRLRTAWTLKLACDEIASKCEQVTMPFLVCHGSDDQVTHVDGSKHLYEQASSQDKEIKVYENAYHLLLLDTDADKVYRDVDEWMVKRMH